MKVRHNATLVSLLSSVTNGQYDDHTEMTKMKIKLRDISFSVSKALIAQLLVFSGLLLFFNWVDWLLGLE